MNPISLFFKIPFVKEWLFAWVLDKLFRYFDKRFKKWLKARKVNIEKLDKEIEKSGNV